MIVNFNLFAEITKTLFGTLPEAQHGTIKNKCDKYETTS